MRIPLEVLENGMASVVASITAPRYRLYSYQITFVVDTGSSETIINEGDTLRFSLSVDNLPFTKNTEIGNIKYEMHKMENVTLSFLTDEPAKIERIRLPFIHVTRGTKRDAESRSLALNIPSLFGTDFLLNNKFSLFLNPSKIKRILKKLRID